MFLRLPAAPSDHDHGSRSHAADFIGSNRGELNAMQRAEVMSFAQTWKHEATGGVFVDLPVGTSNERAAAEAMREIRSILAASGVPPDGIAVRNYHRPASLAHGPHQLSEDPRAGRTLRPVAGGHRAELEPRLFREPAELELRLRDPAQPRRHGRQSGGPRAAARRNAALRRCGAPQSWKNTAQGKPTATQYPATQMRPRSATLANDADACMMSTS